MGDKRASNGRTNPAASPLMGLDDCLAVFAGEIAAAGASGPISTEPLLPMLAIGRDPMTLDDHFQFRPMYLSPQPGRRPQRMLFKTSRQVGKTFAVVASDILDCVSLPGYRSLTVTPFFEQVKKISSDVCSALTLDSPLRGCFVDRTCHRNLLQRSYRTRGVQYFTYAFLDATRVRGTSGIHKCNLDEIQNILDECEPVILSTMDAVKSGGFVNYTGTPLSQSNHMETMWRDTTMCEFLVKCHACNHWNVPNLAHDLLKMIGKDTVVCAKCDRAIHPKLHGQWESPKMSRKRLWAEFADHFQGFHVSQVVHPLHYAYPKKWALLRWRVERWPTFQVRNELLGESADSADRPLGIDNLRAASVLSLPSDPHAMVAMYPFRAVGVDWGGGGIDGTSRTKICCVGENSRTGVVEVFRMVSLPADMQPREQALEVAREIALCQPHVVGHDVNGNSAMQGLMNDMGVPADIMVNFSYTATVNRPIIYPVPNPHGFRQATNIDKTRSVQMLCEAIKSGKVLFPEWEAQLDRDAGTRPTDDFLNFFFELSDRGAGRNLLYYRRDTKRSDDMVHAVNFAVSAMWYRKGRYPNMLPDEAECLTLEELARLDPPGHLSLSDWR